MLNLRQELEEAWQDYLTISSTVRHTLTKTMQCSDPTCPCKRAYRYLRYYDSLENLIPEEDNV